MELPSPTPTTRDRLRDQRRQRAWSVDWIQAPWAASLVGAQNLADLFSFPTCDDLNERLVAPIRFVPAPPRREKVPGRGYEYRAVVDGEVITRPHSWHDLMNALCWATFPTSKRLLTEILVDAQRRAPPGPARLRSQDLLALFDEGGVVANADRRGRLWFGHALYEHRLLLPDVPLRGSLLVVAASANDRTLDQRIAATISAPEFLSTRQPTEAIA